VPPMAETSTDEPLDLGDLTLSLRSPLHVGDMAPLFEARSLDGKDIRLIDYRGKFVLLSFWSPVFHPELERLKELLKTYGAAGKLAIIGFAVGDTLQEVRSYLDEYETEWPQIYLGEDKDNDIAKRYGNPVASYILLVDPEGKIVASWLRGEQLTEAVEKAVPQPTESKSPSGVSGQVLDANGQPATGAQVALITTKASVTISQGRLEPTRFGSAEKAQVVETDAQGRFRFESEPNEGFSLIAAHDAGFARADAGVFKANREVRLEPWGRIEGQVAEGRRPSDDQVWMAGLPNETWLRYKRRYEYETRCDAAGRFAFERVPAGWLEVGYLMKTGDNAGSHTSRTPVLVRPGETVKVRLGGEGRPVIGRFVPPVGCRGSLHFGAGLRALETWRPDSPKPADYDQMTQRRQQEWYSQWRNTPEGQAYSDAIWHNPNRRQYVFRIEPDGRFRIEDVIAGKYTLTVFLEEPFPRPGSPQDLGSYRSTIEVPEIPGGRTDEPLDLGELVLKMHNEQAQVGDTREKPQRADLVPLMLNYPEPGVETYDLEYYTLPSDYEVPMADEPPVVLLPRDVTNVARGKPVTSNSPTEPIIGELEMITDGEKKLMHFVELEPLLSPHRPTQITIDLGREYEIHAVAWWHDFHRPSVYQDVAVQVARDPQFQDAIILYNNDRDDSLGFGKGADPAYIETNKGSVAGADGFVGRYVRLYSRGSRRNLCAQYTEVEVHGRLPQ